MNNSSTYYLKQMHRLHSTTMMRFSIHDRVGIVLISGMQLLATIRFQYYANDPFQPFAFEFNTVSTVLPFNLLVAFINSKRRKIYIV